MTVLAPAANALTTSPEDLNPPSAMTGTPDLFATSLHNAIAVYEGYTGKKSSFVRTPKYGIEKDGDSFRKRRYLAKRPSASTLIEGLLAIYFGYGVWMGLHSVVHVFIIFHVMLTIGFATIFYYTIKHLR